MRLITFDIETENTFDEVGSPEPSALDISVVCAHDSETDEITSYFVDELDKLWPLIEKADALVGYNSDHFDIPLLNKYYDGDLSTIKSIDLMQTIRKGLGRRIKLDDVAQATLGEAKSAHGLQAIIWWRNGEKDKVVEYCKQDVQVTKNLYDFMKKNNYILVEKDGEQKKIEIDTSDWENNEESEPTPQTLF
jgi:DEAD/DEAH box helicase domain-containing protein